MSEKFGSHESAHISTQEMLLKECAEIRDAEIAENEELTRALLTDEETLLLSEMEAMSPDQWIDMGSLKGRNIAGLFGLYLGKFGKLEAFEETDFRNNINELRQRKIAIERYGVRGWTKMYTGGKKRNGLSKDFKRRWTQSVSSGKSKNPVMVHYRDYVKPFVDSEKNFSRITMKEHLKGSQEAIDSINRNLDWERLAEYHKLGSTESRLLKDICKSFDAKDILAYLQTELCPGSDGKFNIKFMEMLFAKGGKEYIDMIPALGDAETSFGGYQFTSQALYDDGVKKKGASVTNQFVDENAQIKGSVIYLRGYDHEKAAYMFAINNVARLLKETQERGITKKVQKNWKNNKIGMVQFIATSHHAPNGVRKYARYWIDNNMKNKYETSCRGRFINYAKKTRANYNAIQKHDFNKQEFSVQNDKYTPKVKKVEPVKPTPKPTIDPAKDILSDRFSSSWESKDGKFLVTRYKIKSGGTPGAVLARYKDFQGKLVDGTYVCDKFGTKYEADTKFGAGKDVYIKEPQSKQPKQETPEQPKPKKEKKEKSSLSEHGVSYEVVSKDGLYDVYVCTVGGKATLDEIESSVKDKVGTLKKGTLITDSVGNVYDDDRVFKKGQRVYIKIPKKSVEEIFRGKFVSKGLDSKKNNRVYIYTIISSGSPKAVLKQYKNLMGELPEGIKVTDGNGVEYKAGTKFGKGKKVFVKVPL